MFYRLFSFHPIFINICLKCSFKRCVQFLVQNLNAKYMKRTNFKIMFHEGLVK